MIASIKKECVFVRDVTNRRREVEVDAAGGKDDQDFDEFMSAEKSKCAK